MYIRLSHILKGDAPVWPGNSHYSYKPADILGVNSTCNTYVIEFHNHTSTHMDAPRHVNNDGVTINELPLESFFYDHPVLLEIPKSYGEFITAEELAAHAAEIQGADLLMVRTGFQPKRDQDPEGYGSNGPAFSAAACKYLMDNFSLKALAMDFVSLANPHHPEEGGPAHQTLVGGAEGKFTYIIEDATFEEIVGKKLKRVYAFPLFAEGIDSSLVTMIAEVE